MELWNAGWIGNLLGLIGLLSGFWFYKKSQRSPRLRTEQTSLAVVRTWHHHQAEVAEDIAMTYRGQPVPQVSVSSITVWNSGNALLAGSVISDLDPLRIETEEGGRILSVSVSTTSRAACGVEAFADTDVAGRVNINFDFLDQFDGAVIQVVHSARHPWVRVCGTLRGVPMIDDLSNASRHLNRRFFWIRALLFFGCAGFMFVALRNIEADPATIWSARNWAVIAVIAIFFMSEWGTFRFLLGDSSYIPKSLRSRPRDKDSFV